MAQVGIRIDFNPAHLVVPLFTMPENKDEPPIFLGTGFFIGKHCQYVTAYHNLPSLTAAVGVLPIHQLHTMYPAKLITYDKRADLAVLEVQGYRPSKWFAPYPNDDIQLGELVICVEFGPTRQVGANTEVSMATRVGNITRRFIKLEQFDKAGEDALEVSFPALKGASGAPILTSDYKLVIGIMMANYAYHLIPAQIEEYVDPEGKEKETIRFMMPQGIAVHVKHLRPLLSD